MRHTEKISYYISVLAKSEKFHLLVVVGAAGWAKTATTKRTLESLGIDYDLLGAYSTPLALFNKLCEVPDQTLVIDDTSGLFTNMQSLGILNAACWPGAGRSSKRTVKWTSTSEKAFSDSVDFEGKIIVLANAMPQSPSARALINRALHYQIKIEPEDIPRLILEAVEEARHFPDKDLARAVARFIGSEAPNYDASRISLRTLELGYEFASHGQDWKEHLVSTFTPKPQESALSKADKPDYQQTQVKVKDLVLDLEASSMPVKDQLLEFQRQTQLSERTFWNKRNALGLARTSKREMVGH